MTDHVPTDHVVSVARTTNVVAASMWREILVANGIRAEVGGTALTTSIYAMVPMLARILRTRMAAAEGAQRPLGILCLRRAATPPLRTAR